MSAGEPAWGNSEGTLFWDGADPRDHAGAAEGRQLFYPGVPPGGRAPDDATVMGIVDSGISVGHPQLAGYVIAEKDFTGEGIQDHLGHGTAVALIALYGNGVSSPPVALAIAKVAGRDGRIRKAHVIAAIDWVVERGAMVVNLSLGFEGRRNEHDDLCTAIARHDGVMFVAAAGNSGPDVDVYPARCGLPNLMAVGATDPSGRPARYSGQGHVLAPGDVRFVKQWYYYYETAQGLARDGQLAQARALYEHSLEIEPSAEAQFQIGVLDLHEDKLAAAIDRFRRAIRLNPGLAEAHEMLGSAQFMRKDYRSAEHALREALVQYPDTPHTRASRARANFNLGQVLMVVGRWSEAEQVLLETRRLAPDYPRLSEALQRARRAQSP